MIQFIVTILLLSVVYNDAYLYKITNSSTPEYPEKCFHPAHQVALAPGETVNVSGKCEKITCDTDFTINGFGCGLIEPAKYPCREIPQDFSKSFPDCCSNVACN